MNFVLHLLESVECFILKVKIPIFVVFVLLLLLKIMLLSHFSLFPSFHLWTMRLFTWQLASEMAITEITNNFFSSETSPKSFHTFVISWVCGNCLNWTGPRNRLHRHDIMQSNLTWAANLSPHIKERNCFSYIMSIEYLFMRIRKRFTVNVAIANCTSCNNRKKNVWREKRHGNNKRRSINNLVPQECWAPFCWGYACVRACVVCVTPVGHINKKNMVALIHGESLISLPS